MNTMFSVLFIIAFSLEHELLEDVVATGHNAVGGIVSLGIYVHNRTT
jgi:hypothetical protein